MARGGGRSPLNADGLTTELLRTYQYGLSKRGCRPRSIRSAFHPLKGLCAFLVAHGVLADNPCSKLTMPKKDAAKRLTISTSEIVALLEGAGRLHPLRRASLARAVVYTLVYTGVRFQELLDLKLGDVDLEAGTLLVAHGKGDKSRMLYPNKVISVKALVWGESTRLPHVRGLNYSPSLGTLRNLNVGYSLIE